MTDAPSPRTVTEIHEFDAKTIEEMCKNYAKMAIVGSYYKGEFISQEVRWEGRKFITILTTHKPEVK